MAVSMKMIAMESTYQKTKKMPRDKIKKRRLSIATRSACIMSSPEKVVKKDNIYLYVKTFK